MPSDPVLPSGFEFFGPAILILWAALTITALVSLTRSRSLTGAQHVIWTVAVLVIPVIGASGWLIKSALQRAHRSELPS
ncbi:PLDc N-terminal domain-containing protein [Leifsonia poae]|uniref:PLDc N-terminal domain-containing protein n=1 Tax=Leifsonia poae TaxID=110933 RepID=UPI001CBF7E61